MSDAEDRAFSETWPELRGRRYNDRLLRCTATRVRRAHSAATTVQLRGHPLNMKQWRWSGTAVCSTSRGRRQRRAQLMDDREMWRKTRSSERAGCTWEGRWRERRGNRCHGSGGRWMRDGGGLSRGCRRLRRTGRAKSTEAEDRGARERKDKRHQRPRPPALALADPGRPTPPPRRVGRTHLSVTHSSPPSTPATPSCPSPPATPTPALPGGGILQHLVQQMLD